jgi:hypothetical protein
MWGLQGAGATGSEYRKRQNIEKLTKETFQARFSNFLDK